MTLCYNVIEYILHQNGCKLMQPQLYFTLSKLNPQNLFKGILCPFCYRSCRSFKLLFLFQTKGFRLYSVDKWRNIFCLLFFEKNFEAKILSNFRNARNATSSTRRNTSFEIVDSIVNSETRILKNYRQLFRQETFDGNWQKTTKIILTKKLSSGHTLCQGRNNTWTTVKIENCVKLCNAQIS